VWTVIETIHGMPLTSYDPAAAWNEHATDLSTVIYADRISDSLLKHLNSLSSENVSGFVYTWAPGQILPYLTDSAIEVRAVHDSLVKRFQQ
jgi:hypothetical protein